LGRRRRQALGEQHPRRHRGERQRHGHDDERREQHGERRGQPPRHRGIGDHTAESQAQQRLGPADLRLGAVGLAQQPERTQGGVDELPDVVRADQPPGGRADLGRDLLDRPPSVDGDQHLVQQRRQLQDLAVPAAGKRGRPAVAGPREFPEQLDALGAGQDLGARGPPP